MTYLSYLDPERMIFNDRQVAFILKRFGNNLNPTYLAKGDVYPAFEIFNSFTRKAKERIAWIQQRLDQPFELDRDNFYRINHDTAHLEWPKNWAETNKKWEDYLKFQFINEMLTGQNEETAVQCIRDKYDHFLEIIEDFDPVTVREYFLNALTSLYDPHSSYFS